MPRVKGGSLLTTLVTRRVVLVRLDQKSPHLLGPVTCHSACYEAIPAIYVRLSRMGRENGLISCGATSKGRV
jgi:hypothetical protein